MERFFTAGELVITTSRLQWNAAPDSEAKLGLLWHFVLKYFFILCIVTKTYWQLYVVYIIEVRLER